MRQTGLVTATPEPHAKASRSGKRGAVIAEQKAVSPILSIASMAAVSGAASLSQIYFLVFSFQTWIHPFFRCRGPKRLASPRRSRVQRMISMASRPIVPKG